MEGLCAVFCGDPSRQAWDVIAVPNAHRNPWGLLELTEYASRFNRRRTPMAAFQTLLGLAAQHPPTTYKRLYGVESTG